MSIIKDTIREKTNEAISENLMRLGSITLQKSKAYAEASKNEKEAEDYLLNSIVLLPKARQIKADAWKELEDARRREIAYREQIESIFFEMGMSKKLIWKLERSGIYTFEQLDALDECGYLMAIPGVGESTMDEIKEYLEKWRQTKGETK